MFVDIYNTDKKYNIIYADPPWKFSSKQLQKEKGKRFNSLDKEYSTVETNQMQNWDVKRICDDNCAIFMWTTDAHIKEAIELMKSWGFKYSTVAFVWSKRSINGKELYTLGAWTLKNCEICLLGTRGKMLQYKKSNQVKQLIKAERTKHSKKPDIVREKIVEIFGELPRIELFARQHAEGWDCWR